MHLDVLFIFPFLIRFSSHLSAAQVLAIRSSPHNWR